jgi:hypothetical protein
MAFFPQSVAYRNPSSGAGHFWAVRRYFINAVVALRAVLVKK